MNDYIRTVLRQWDESDDSSIIPMELFNKMVGYDVPDLVFDGTHEEYIQTVEKAIDIWWTVLDELTGKRFWYESLNFHHWFIWNVLCDRLWELEEIEEDHENDLRYILVNQAVINFRSFYQTFEKWSKFPFDQVTAQSESLMDNVRELVGRSQPNYQVWIWPHLFKFFVAQNVQHLSQPDFNGFDTMSDRDWILSVRNMQIFVFRRYMQSLLPLDDLEKICIGGPKGIGHNEPTIHVDPDPPYIDPRGLSKYDRLSSHLKRAHPNFPQLPND